MFDNQDLDDTRCTPESEREKMQATIARLEAENAGLRDLAADAVSALRYIEQTFGKAPGVGWDRVYKKATDASKALERANG